MSQQTILDIDSYHNLSEPFENAEVAEAAVEAFWNEFYELRNKHRLADVYVILAIPIRYEDGDAGTVMAKLHAGDDMKSESMVAWAFGQEGAARRERIARLISANKSIKERITKR